MNESATPINPYNPLPSNKWKTPNDPVLKQEFNDHCRVVQLPADKEGKDKGKGKVYGYSTQLFGDADTCSGRPK